MAIKDTLLVRGNSKCELCSSDSKLNVYEVEPLKDDSSDSHVLACEKCNSQIQGPDTVLDENHWRCLNESMWSEHIVVRVLAWRVLTRLSTHGWASDLVTQLYFEAEDLKWAEAGVKSSIEGSSTKDSNGAGLSDGDSVTLIKDLEVKGAGFTAKRGTLVKSISLTDNPEQIEGRVSGMKIVLLTKFLKKA
jgi:protein PhnA